MDKKLLFAHGWATDNYVWNSFLDKLPKEYDIYNPLLPGHGTGNPALWGSSTLTPAVDLISGIVRDIGSSGLPIGIGWSLGALSLMKTELERPGSFRALILVAATPSFVSNNGSAWGIKKAIVRKMMIDLKKDPQAALKRFYRLNFTGAELEGREAEMFLRRYCDFKGDLDLLSLANSLDTLYKINIADEIASLALPVLIIHGSNDSVTPIAAADYLDEHIRDSRLFVMDSAGHAPLITDPKLFYRITHGFISEIFSN